LSLTPWAARLLSDADGCGRLLLLLPSLWLPLLLLVCMFLHQQSHEFLDGTDSRNAAAYHDELTQRSRSRGHRCGRRGSSV
jgi:hypothetical protein